MKRLISRAPFLAFAFALFAASTLAAAQVPLANPNLELLRSGMVQAIAQTPDGHVIVGGSFLRVSGQSRRGLAVLASDGTLDTAITIDANGDVNGLLISGASAYVWGSFTQIGGFARAGLARVDLITAGVEAWNPSPNNGIQELVTDANGDVYVTMPAGSSIGGLTGVSVAKIDKATGAGVGTWAPAFPVAIVPGNLASTGSHIYVEGALDTPAATQNRRIYRVAMDGTLDSGWNANLTAIDMAIVDMAVDLTGSLVVVGVVQGAGPPPGATFTAPSTLTKLQSTDGQVPAGWTATHTHRHFAVRLGDSGLYVVRWNLGTGDFGDQVVAQVDPATGSDSGTWVKQHFAGANSLGQALEVTATGVFHGGEFSYVEDVRRSSIVHLLSGTGAVDGAFTADIVQQGFVSASDVLPDGSIIAVGSITSANGMPVDNMILLNPDGTRNEFWDIGVYGLATAVRHIDGMIYVGGSFKYAAGFPRAGVVRFDAALISYDGSWAPLIDGGVRGFAGDATHIYLAGGFHNVEGNPRPCFARIDATTAILDTVWAPNQVNFAPGSACGRAVEIAGGFAYLTAFSGRLVVNGQNRYMARVSLTTGASDGAFDPVPDSFVRAMTQDATHLYVTGSFANIGGAATRVAKIDKTTGVVDTAFLNAFDPAFSAFAITKSSDGVYIGATRQNPDFSTSLLYHRLALGGAVDGTWVIVTDVPRASFNTAVRSRGDGTVFIGSGFSVVNGVPRMAMAIVPATVGGPVFTVAKPYDFNGDGRADIAWRDPAGQAAIWLLDTATPIGSSLMLGPDTGWSVTDAKGDFNGDNRADFVWRHTDGSVSIWLLDGTTVLNSAIIFGPNADWRVAHTADLNGDGRSDLIWKNDTDGSSTAWIMNGTTASSSGFLLGAGSPWTFTHHADFNNDGRQDLVLRHTDGSTAIWLMDGLTVTSGIILFGPTTDWSVTHVADFNGDGNADLLWRNSATGDISMWLLNGTTVIGSGVIFGGDVGWQVVHVGDFDANARSDLLWRHTDGRVAVWSMDGLTPAFGTALIYGGDPGWVPIGLRDTSGDGRQDILWRHTDGRVAVWIMNSFIPTASSALLFGGSGGWAPVPAP